MLRIYFLLICMVQISCVNASVDMSTFFKQKTEVAIINKRIDLFKVLLAGKKVLHVGCTDFPIFNPECNLHLQLVEFVAQLDGCDLDKEGIEQLRRYFNGRYFANLSEVKESYDFVLVPEVLEHVPNIELFLQQLNDVNTEYYFISAPNAFFSPDSRNFHLTSNAFFEEVHPDHNCWFSPYTLNNCIKKYTTWTVLKTFLLEKNTMVGVICKKN